MKYIVDKYYNGYEGEPEIQIIRRNYQEEVLVLKIWTGFFDNIMNAIEPEETGWTSLAYYYNLHIGWYEESPWKLEDIRTAINQLKSIENNKLSGQDKEVLNDIIKIFQDALMLGDDILICYE
ncbi:MAG: hypothetical protein K2L15_05035 [Eubacteriales bacterium]|nr:hypothetical protein [Eubacteriales bacterium]